MKEEIQIAESKNKILLLECESLKKNKENNNINLDSDFLIKEESKIQNEETNTKKNFERKKEFPFETENPIKRMKFFN